MVFLDIYCGVAGLQSDQPDRVQGVFDIMVAFTLQDDLVVAISTALEIPAASAKAPALENPKPHLMIARMSAATAIHAALFLMNSLAVS